MRTIELVISLAFCSVTSVVVKNWGEISSNNPGAGNRAWLFADEIEVNTPTP